MFPGDHWWISAHAQHAEENQIYRINDETHSGFADVMIGCTVVEYEKNLTKTAIFDEGYRQVEDYCAGLLNRDVAPDKIIGVLSDTVRWHAYEVELRHDVTDGGVWGREDIRLHEIDYVDMSDINDDSLTHFEDFINRYYGRIGSRKLTPDALVEDFGITTKTTETYRRGMQELVSKAAAQRSKYAKLVKNLWTRFVGTVGGTTNRFEEDFTHELYLVTLAKLIAANVISGGIQTRDRRTIASVLDGSYFISNGINNLVEYDYFGWINEGENLEALTVYAMSMQKDLMVYDFSQVRAEDLFGPLVAQLANADKRLLLGQAPTPAWLADRMVSRILDELDGREPRLVDMCVGSGIFIVSALAQIIKRIKKEGPVTAKKAVELAESVCGFDIDPVAVLLAKVNWVLVMKPYMNMLPDDLHIPIYHADSLFTRTPVASDINGEGDTVVQLYDQKVRIPGFILDSAFRRSFDKLVYDADVIAGQQTGAQMAREHAEILVRKDFAQHGPMPNEADVSLAVDMFIELIEKLGDLRSRDRNGIWPFILNNTFKPALTGRLFNGIVSNPPWLALSRIAQNPYKDSLVRLAKEYGVMPGGSAFLHVEIATIFLISAVDRYLDEEGRIACIMPRSILNGRHEEEFRRKGYARAKRPVAMTPTEVWEIPEGTFRNKAVVLFGVKKSDDTQQMPSELDGEIIRSSDLPGEKCSFKLVTNGKVTAYAHEAETIEKALESVTFNQGFDGMPRTAVFFKADRQPNGKWTLASIPMSGTPLSQIVSAAKKCRDFRIGSIANNNSIANIDESLIYDAVTSNMVMPFVQVTPSKAFLPVSLEADGKVRELTDGELSLLGPGCRLLADAVKNVTDANVKFYRKGYIQYIDNRSKLSMTLSDDNSWRVVYGAGGTNIAATAFRVDDISRKGRLAIDQTLYWRGVSTEDEALYYMGLLNSDAINDSIKSFQPEGEFGERHIHSLPWVLMDTFDPSNEQHQEIVSKTRKMVSAVAALCDKEPRVHKLTQLGSRLSSRRGKFRSIIKEMPEFKELDKACRMLV